jgi:hypothetical protein
LVEHQLPKLRVAGSNPVVRFSTRAAPELAEAHRLRANRSNLDEAHKTLPDGVKVL